MEQPLLFQLKGQVGTITFNRPNELNAVNLDMARAMGELARKLPSVDGMKFDFSDGDLLSKFSS